ncbi:hypothetical protein [Bacillus sp. FJAT-27251]|uniref:hypothetical protein n=1 Tax=Bacillus sp. FJAT-27251 TaxID=1684142 RepID=UPI0006A78C75|nr:hypothetical protein [Bacillus sp. FJAT-27251]
MGTGTVFVAVILAIYVRSIMKRKPFSQRKRLFLYMFVLFTVALTIMVTVQADLGFIVHAMNQTIGATVKRALS